MATEKKHNKVGVIGLGIMGSSISSNLQKSGNQGVKVKSEQILHMIEKEIESRK